VRIADSVVEVRLVQGFAVAKDRSSPLGIVDAVPVGSQPNDRPFVKLVVLWRWEGC